MVAPHELSVAPGRIEVLAGDMTAVISCEMSLAQAQEELGAVDQWLAVDGPEDWPVGDLIDANSTGPLRLGCGGWRDLLLGVQFFNGLDELITAGGRAMKNVAGYDLTKFMVGQCGCFGRLATATARTYRRPAGAIHAEFDATHPPPPGLLTGPLAPQWALQTELTLYCGYLGDEPTLLHYQSALAAAHPAGATLVELEEDIEMRQGLWPICDGAVLRASVAPTRVGDFIDRAGHPYEWVADPAFGLVLVPLSDTIDALAVGAAAVAAGGSAFVTEPHDDYTELRGVHMDATQRLVFERLKAAFDPHGRLRPLPG